MRGLLLFTAQLQGWSFHRAGGPIGLLHHWWLRYGPGSLSLPKVLLNFVSFEPGSFRLSSGLLLLARQMKETEDGAAVAR